LGMVFAPNICVGCGHRRPLRSSMWLSASLAHACTRTNDTSYLPEPSVTNVCHLLESGSEAHRNRKGPYARVRPALLQNSEVLQLPALARVSADFPVAKYRRGMLAFCTMICDRLTLAKPRDGVKISTVHKAYGPFLVRYCSDPLSDYRHNRSNRAGLVAVYLTVC
jgi:hypothetical protein